ncbi:MAG: TlpA family protein disulfide reductase [Rhodocyclales bacterium]|nr:TlpA family protein disulfide reductase [Rhodocyclales bacterium]
MIEDALFSRALRTAIVAVGLVLSPLAVALEAGSPAPDLDLQNADGAPTLKQLRGKVVYLDFWASWCAPCKNSFPWMNELQAKFGPQGFKVIAVHLDANGDDRKKFLASVPANFDIAADPTGAVAKRYQVKGMPSSVLIDRDGKVLLQHVGFNEHARQRLETAIQSALEKRL